MTTRRPLAVISGVVREVPSGDTLSADVIPGMAVTALKTANYTAAANEFVRVDTTSGSWIVTFPTAPADGTRIGVKQSVRGGTNTVGLALGGSDVFNVAGGNTTGTLTLSSQGGLWQYVASGAIWVAIANDLSLTQLDARYQAQFDTKAPAVLLSSGEEIISREVVSANTALVGGRVQLTYFTARKSETTTQVKVHTGATGAGATPSLCRIGLYSIDGSGNGTLAAATVNDTTLFGSTNSGFTRSWSSSYSKVAGQMYALGIIVISSAAMPTLASIAGAANAAAMWSTDRRLTANINSQTDLPSSFVPGSLTTSGVRFYGEILP